ncbi:MAG: hypothetical protein MJ071_08805 [Oscillospiraceae bacterium]|nr:hypothetical protein [Oscillospiraceae bacterium]
MNIVMHETAEKDIAQWQAQDVLHRISAYRKHHFPFMEGKPEKARLFQKYGSPETVADVIAKGGTDLFFSNSQMVMTGDYLLMPENPESLMQLNKILLAYPFCKGKTEYLVAMDCWGDQIRYPFSGKERQVFRIDILLDKIQKCGMNCRIGHRPEDIAYANQRVVPLI